MDFTRMKEQTRRSERSNFPGNGKGKERRDCRKEYNLTQGMKIGKRNNLVEMKYLQN